MMVVIGVRHKRLVILFAGFLTKFMGAKMLLFAPVFAAGAGL
jgi:hypothetical protein